MKPVWVDTKSFRQLHALLIKIQQYVHFRLARPRLRLGAADYWIKTGQDNQASGSRPNPAAKALTFA